MERRCIHCALKIRTGTESWLQDGDGKVVARHHDCGVVVGLLVETIEAFLEAETSTNRPIQFTAATVADLAHEIREALFTDGVL